MTRILRSLAVRYPFLLSAIVLAVALVTGRLAQEEIGSVLVDESRADLRQGAERIAGLLAGGVPASKSRQLALAGSAESRRVLEGALPLATADGILARQASIDPPESLAAARLLAHDGTPRARWSRVPGATAMGWTTAMLRAGRLPTDSAVIGPVVSINDTLPGYVSVAPVRAADGRLLGYREEVHTARGSGVAEIRALIEVERLLVGSREWTVWTDLETVVDGPELVAAPESLQVVVLRGARMMGLARGVPGTEWLVWVDRPEAAVMAPVDRFLRRVWISTLLIALAGALLAWLLARRFSQRIRHVAAELDRTLMAHGHRHAPADGGDDADADADAADELRQLEEAYAALEARVEQRQSLDAQVLQAQKLEAVGRLAGGIAHDFNNLLTVMASYAAMAREGVPPESTPAKDIDEVLKAVDRATALTRQLLAFSRQRLTDAQPLDLNAVVRGTESMLARLIPSNVERVVSLTSDLPKVEADPTQLEQVLINLVVNAVDAMPDGGRLTLETSVTGDRVCLAVGDTGVGMDAETVARIFDPFFTTKPLGKGTGLGLATAHGIVEALHGRIDVQSAPQRGTTMRVLLPIAGTGKDTATNGRAVAPISAEHIAPGLILLAEDDPSTRDVIRRVLEAAGHRVEAHETADGALMWLRARGDARPPLAVITDVMMPGLGGIQFARLLRDEFPTLPVIVASGYADAGDRLTDELAAWLVVLEKPFTAKGLHDALRRAVGVSPSGGQA